MIYLLKLKNGEEMEIKQDVRDALTAILLGRREDRPDYVEIESKGAVISTVSIASITALRRERGPMMVIEPEEIEERQRRRDAGEDVK